MHNQPTDIRSALARLRALPHGSAATRSNALRSLAERQATLLCYLTAGKGAPLDVLVGRMPRITVRMAAIPTSGLSHWDGQQWVITVNAGEPRRRQRFTVLHEFKHIVDHPDVSELYQDNFDATAGEQMEHAADYFAGCALVPGSLLTDTWNSGITTPYELAQLFDVSVPAIKVRLVQVGLVSSRVRCTPQTDRRQHLTERLAR